MTETIQPRFSRVATNGVSLHVMEAGPKDGPLLILLHGFPEFWYGWRHQIGPLAARGFHVVVPDQRGYNLSEKSKDVMSYGLGQLAADVIGLADHYGAPRFFLAGHDWGSTVGWWTAQSYSGRVARFVSLNAGHPAVWKAQMESNREQRKKSRYVKMFAVPWLPEALMRLKNFKVLAEAVTGTAKSGVVSEDDLVRYRAAWSQKGALTGSVNWYRALLKTKLKPPGAYRISVPTLVVWGMKDIYGNPKMAEASASLCDTADLLWLEGASHWVLSDEADRVTAAMLEFFKR